LEVSKIVRGADSPDKSLTPQSEGLVAGFSLISKDEHDNIAKKFCVYDALLAFCKTNR
jgi:hypothetical protein